MKDYICDIEANGFDADKIHCMSISSKAKSGKWVVNTTTDYDKMRKIILDPNVRIWGHYFINYDLPTLERVLGVKAKCEVVCTLAASWTLFPYRTQGTHGLEGWGETFGVPKVKVEDDEWVGLSDDKLSIIEYYEKQRL